MEEKYISVPWLAQVEGNDIVIQGYKRTVALVSGTDDESIDIARLIASAPALARKLADTVEWLDREIEFQDVYPTDNDKLTELRDDLKTTLRKVRGE